MGVGFVGAVMAGIVADAVDKKTGKPSKFVIGMQRPSPRSYWKIPLLNRGIAPVEAEDPEVAPLIARCVNEKKTLTATYTYDALTPGRLRRRGRPVRLLQGGPRQLPPGPRRDRRPRGEPEGHRREDPPGLPRPDRDDRPPGDHRIRRLPDPEEGLREARDRHRAPPRPLLRAGHARAANTSPPSGTSGGSAAGSTTPPANGSPSSSPRS